jgi:hypothetical protein
MVVGDFPIETDTIVNEMRVIKLLKEYNQRLSKRHLNYLSQRLLL